MTYEAVVDALALLIQSLDHFDDQSVDVGDWKVASEGHDNPVVIEYVRFVPERINADQTTMITWTCRIHLLARYEDDEEAHDLLRDRREEIILKILQNPTITNTAFDAMVTGGEADEDEVEIGGISFLKETIDIEIEEEVSA